MLSLTSKVTGADEMPTTTSVAGRHPVDREVRRVVIASHLTVVDWVVSLRPRDDPSCEVSRFRIHGVANEVAMRRELVV